MNDIGEDVSVVAEGLDIYDEGPRYKLEVFEGPLDLLLHLIAKHKLDIYDIPIIELVDQYMAYVEMMRERDMDVAADFLAMAARLVLMKSAALLPVYDETAETMKRELTGELIDYRDCKKAASLLSDNSSGFDFSVRDGEDLSGTAPYSRRYPAERIFKAYVSAVGKGKLRLPPPASAFTRIIASKIVSVASKFPLVIAFLQRPGKHYASSLFASGESRSDLIALFLSLLELVKNKNVRLSGELGGELIELADPDLKGLTYDE